MNKLIQNKGFTLLEILVAMTIMSIGLLGVAGLTSGIIRGNYLSKNVTSATVVAQDQLEEVQRVGYANATTAIFPAGAQTIPMGGVNFSRTTAIADGTPAANMKTVTVTVTSNSGPASATLSTILAQ